MCTHTRLTICNTATAKMQQETKFLGSHPCISAQCYRVLLLLRFQHIRKKGSCSSIYDAIPVHGKIERAKQGLEAELHLFAQRGLVPQCTGDLVCASSMTCSSQDACWCSSNDHMSILWHTNNLHTMVFHPRKSSYNTAAK